MIVQLLFYCALTIFLGILVYSDLQTQLVDDRIVFAGIACVWPLQWLMHGWCYPLTGMLIGLLVSLAVYYLAQLISRERQGFGGGDVTASMFIGLATGWYGFVFVFVAAHIIHVLITLVIAVHEKKMDVGAPFLPALALATVADFAVPDGIAGIFTRLIAFL